MKPAAADYPFDSDARVQEAIAAKKAFELTTGDAVRNLCMRGGLWHTELPDRLNAAAQARCVDLLPLEKSDIVNWTNPTVANRVKVHAHRLEDIATVFNLEPKAKTLLIQNRLPALNPVWLNEQPVFLQAGWMLEAFREREGLKQKNLCAPLGFTSIGSVANLEVGRTFISSTHQEKLKGVLTITPDEEAEFTKRIIESNKAITVRNSTLHAMKKAETKMGAVHPLGAARRGRPSKQVQALLPGAAVVPG